MKTLRGVLAYLVARAHEASSIVSVSGAGAVLAAYFTQQISGRAAAVGVVASLLGYVMPQDKAMIDALAGAIRGAAPAIAVAIVSAGLLVGCASSSSPVSQPAQPLTAAQLQQDAQMALWLLKAAGCATADASAIASPVVAVSADAKGQQTLQAVSAGGQVACQVTVPPSALPAPAPANAPAVTVTVPAVS